MIMPKSFVLPPLSAEDYELHSHFPAARGSGKYYLIQDCKIVGEMRMVSATGYFNGAYPEVIVEPANEAATEFFKDDWSVPLMGKVSGLRYNGILGRPMKGPYSDEPEDRHMGTEIVDTVEFDFGIAHRRFSNVKGWGEARNRSLPSVKSIQKKRRSRSSNKIKKVA
jgi:hypothetical protein